MRIVDTAGAGSSNGMRRLTDEDLGGVSGGLKWTPGTKNSDVIDARGGQVKILWFTVTLDVNGKPSSIS